MARPISTCQPPSQVLDDFDLVGNLGAAQKWPRTAAPDGCTAMPRYFSSAPSAGRRGLATNGTMPAVEACARGGAERIVDVEVAERRELFANAGSFFVSSA